MTSKGNNNDLNCKTITKMWSIAIIITIITYVFVSDFVVNKSTIGSSMIEFKTFVYDFTNIQAFSHSFTIHNTDLIPRIHGRAIDEPNHWDIYI